jgi:hypothetical protein
VILFRNGTQLGGADGGMPAHGGADGQIAGMLFPKWNHYQGAMLIIGISLFNKNIDL